MKGGVETGRNPRLMESMGESHYLAATVNEATALSEEHRAAASLADRSKARRLLDSKPCAHIEGAQPERCVGESAF